MRALLFAYLRKRLLESSTYAGIVGILTAWLYNKFGIQLTIEEQNQLVTLGLAVMSTLLLFISERKGANPNNALPPPPGTSPVVTPTAANGRGAVVVQPADLPPSATVVQTAPQPSVSESQPKPVRPGFGPY